MKRVFLIAALCQLSFLAIGQNFKQRFITSDLDNFWFAFDKINGTTDSTKKYAYLNEIYFEQASQGVSDLRSARNYTDKDFIEMIGAYPQYLNSIRANTMNAQIHFKSIEKLIAKLNKAYPELKPASIYFAVGSFRSGGTYMNRNVLLGSEVLFATKESDISELPETLQGVLKEYAPYDIPLIALHEYVHTQQKEWGHTILTSCVGEGVAEFISTLIAERPLSPAVAYGKQNSEVVLNKFMEDLFIDFNVGNWLWNENQNELKVRDLGYYIGYEICERYYNQAPDKQQAIKELIELDYSNNEEFARIVDASKFLPLTVNEIGSKYESLKPTIKKIKQFKNGSQKVSPELKEITLIFSEPMDVCCRSFDYGPLGEGNSLKVENVSGWSDDYKKFTFTVNLKPAAQHQLLISNFRNKNGNSMVPYTIDITTKTK
jgi:hypothetical protein